ncbi:MAG: transcription antitermination factor NusB [Phascolarctobacterium sp.]|nr:transcription antitermination factor NusB [Phascolarctobacterium sp.]
MSRRIARELAIQALFQIDFNSESIDEALDIAADVYHDMEEKGRSEYVEAAQKAFVAKEASVELEEVETNPVNDPIIPSASQVEVSRAYAQGLVNGVIANKEAIDEKIIASAIDWKIERMPAIDRNIMRVAAYEMLFAGDRIDFAVAINEAVEIAKIYGTKDSARFVNGVLGKMTK